MENEVNYNEPTRSNSSLLNDTANDMFKIIGRAWKPLLLSSIVLGVVVVVGMFVILLLGLLAGAPIIAYAQSDDSQFGENIIYLGIPAYVAIILPFILGVPAKICVDAWRGKPCKAGAAFGFVLARYHRLVFVTIFVTGLCAVYFLLMLEVPAGLVGWSDFGNETSAVASMAMSVLGTLIPVLTLLIAFLCAFLLPLIIDKNIGLFRAVRLSFALAFQKFWQGLGITFLLGVLPIAIAPIILTPFSIGFVVSFWFPVFAVCLYMNVVKQIVESAPTADEAIS